MISSLLIVASCVAIVAGAGTAYWFWDKRNKDDEEKKLLPSVSSPVAETSVPAIAAVAAPVKPQPLIPDPWLSDELAEPFELESAPPGLTIPTEAPAAVAETKHAGELCDAIARLGDSKQLQQVAYLTRYVHHADGKVRETVATALGKIAANRAGKTIEAIVPVLGRLSQDTQPQVQLQAIVALGKIQSPTVLPWLQRAQKSPNQHVVKATAIALQQLKLIYAAKAAPAKPAPSNAAPNRQELYAVNRRF